MKTSVAARLGAGWLSRVLVLLGPGPQAEDPQALGSKEDGLPAEERGSPKAKKRRLRTVTDGP